MPLNWPLTWGLNFCVMWKAFAAGGCTNEIFYVRDATILTAALHPPRCTVSGLCHSYPVKPVNYGVCTESLGLKPDLTPPWAMAAGLWDHGGL